MPKPINILHLLNERNISSWNWSREYSLVQSLQKRCVQLASVLDGSALHSHVILGFSRRGDGVISYCCHADSTQYRYHLYWWKFNLYRKMTLVLKVELFRNEEIEQPLYIAVYDDGIWAYVLGCRSQTMLETKPCYVSILPSHPAAAHTHSFHFKFELLLPYPIVYIDAGHWITDHYGCLLLNTGVSFICVKFEAKEHTLAENKFVSWNRFWFHSTMNSDESSAVPIYMFNEPFETPMSLRKPKSSSLCDSKVMSVVHITFDVDSWISAILPLLLCDVHLDYQCLCDYHIKLLEMDVEFNVTFLLWGIVQLSSKHALQYVKKHFTLVGRWNMHSGNIQTLRHCQLSDKMSSHRWIHAWCQTKWRREITKSPFLRVKELSNKALLTGNSLLEISHPFIPISLVL